MEPEVRNDRSGLSIAFAKTAAKQWEDLVRASVATGDVDHFIAEVAKWTRTNPKTVKAKVLGIRAECLRGSSIEQIIEMGQSECLSRQIGARKAARAGDPDRTLSFRMPRSLADAWENANPSPDQVEPVTTRLHRVCGLETAEDLFDFLKSFLDDIPDEILAQYAGVIPKKEQPKGGR